MSTLLRTFLLACLLPLNLLAQPVSLTVDLQAPPRPLPRYWQATGYSPAAMTLNPDFRLYLNYLKALPGDAVEYIRPHYLLDHVQVENPGTEAVSYDFSGLDEILDVLVENDLKLIFELMGNPGGYFTDFMDSTQLYAWRDLVSALATHLIDRYGQEEVRSWYFETSNEPDIRHFWTQGILPFLRYYDACSEGLLAVDPALRFGGPGQARGNSTVFQLFLEHIDFGINTFTGKQDVRADFITWHRKETPHDQIDDELELIEYMQKKHPGLLDLPLGNDEADPLAGWGIPFWWRTGPWYAAYITQAIDLHNQHFLDSLGLDYFVLSNDNAFMGSWGKRTHLARFLPGDNEADVRNSAAPGGKKVREADQDERQGTDRFYLIKKPCLTVMSLLALLGEERFPVTGLPTENKALGAMATSLAGGGYAFLAYHKPELEVRKYDWKPAMEPWEEDLSEVIGAEAALELALPGLPAGTYREVRYRLDETQGHAYPVWQEAGSPEDPTPEQYQQLMAAMEPVRTVSAERELEDETSLAVDFSSPGVELILLLPDPGAAPAAPTELSAQGYTGLQGEPMRMLLWEAPADPAVQTYELHFAPQGKRRFERLNPVDLLDTGFLHQAAQPGRYKVRAVDHWGRKGAFSAVLEVGE